MKSEVPAPLTAWLKSHALRVDTRAMREHLDSRNPTLLCRDRQGHRVFVKAAVRGDPGVAHERRVLEALRALPELPRLRHASRGILAMEWLQGRTLWSLRRSNKQSLDALIGAALARVQLQGRAAVAKFIVRGDLGKRILWPSPELYASLSPASLNLFRQVQQSPALRSLRHLLERESAEPPLLVHGDLRQPNIMLHRGKVTFVDWELCGLGDPARDLGMLLADDVRAWLLPRDEEEQLTRAQLDQHARALVKGWEDAAISLGHAFAEDHRERVIGWAGEALLRAAYTIAQSEASLPQPLVDAALAMLETPADWSQELLGA